MAFGNSPKGLAWKAGFLIWIPIALLSLPGSYGLGPSQYLYWEAPLIFTYASTIGLVILLGLLAVFSFFHLRLNRGAAVYPRRAMYYDEMQTSCISWRF